MSAVIEKDDGKGSMIGISKGHQTKSTGFTSNPHAGNTTMFNDDRGKLED